MQTNYQPNYIPPANYNQPVVAPPHVVYPTVNPTIPIAEFESDNANDCCPCHLIKFNVKVYPDFVEYQANWKTWVEKRVIPIKSIQTFGTLFDSIGGWICCFTSENRYNTMYISTIASGLRNAHHLVIRGDDRVLAAIDALKQAVFVNESK